MIFTTLRTVNLNVSIHFNASDAGRLARRSVARPCTDPGRTGAAGNRQICAASGLKNRGPKYRDNLAFLNNTAAPAILVEVSFVNSSADTKLYQDNFKDICGAIADGIAEYFDGDYVDVEVEEELPEPPEPPGKPVTGVLFQAIGKCSYFGGPGDTTGVSATKGCIHLRA